MAIPFYNQGDQEIYASGDKFIPQEQYRLGYTAPPSIANASTGITNTQAASPYIWPPQGGGGGGGNFGGSNNKFGLNMDTLKTISQPRYVEQGGPANMYGGNYVKDDRRIAQTEGGIWKDVDTGQNIYHANLNVKTPMTMIMDKLSGKKTTDDPYAGTWYGSDWSDEDEAKGLYSRATGPKNIIQRWKANREIKKQEKIAADKAAADAVAAQTLGPNNPLIGKIDHTGGGITRDPGSVVEGAPTHSTRDDLMAQGGRIGLRPGGIVDVGKQYYGKEDWEIQQINKYGVSYPEFLQNQYGKGLHELNASQIALAVKAWDKFRAGQAKGGRIGLYAGGDPEEPAENIFEFMQDQGISSGDMASGEGMPFMWEEFLDAVKDGFPGDYNDFLDAIDASPWDEASTQDQGIASIV